MVSKRKFLSVPLDALKRARAKTRTAEKSSSPNQPKKKFSRRKMLGLLGTGAAAGTGFYLSRKKRYFGVLKFLGREWPYSVKLFFSSHGERNNAQKILEELDKSKKKGRKYDLVFLEGPISEEMKKQFMNGFSRIRSNYLSGKYRDEKGIQSDLQKEYGKLVPFPEFTVELFAGCIKRGVSIEPIEVYSPNRFVKLTSHELYKDDSLRNYRKIPKTDIESKKKAAMEYLVARTNYLRFRNKMIEITLEDKVKERFKSLKVKDGRLTDMLFVGADHQSLSDTFAKKRSWDLDYEFESVLPSRFETVFKQTLLRMVEDPKYVPSERDLEKIMNYLDMGHDL
ncbi:MAG: hypothetical protein ABID38_01040 [Candidatus Diapherotrites archaeon]